MTEPMPPTPPTPPVADYAAVGPHPGPGPNPYTGPVPDKDSVSMGMLCHLLGIFTAFIGPLIIWLMKKETSPFVDDQGKEALNFQIVCIILTPLCFLGLCFAPILLAALHITRIVFSIIATVKANQGIAYRYPVTFRFIK